MTTPRQPTQTAGLHERCTALTRRAGRTISTCACPCTIGEWREAGGERTCLLAWTTVRDSVGLVLYQETKEKRDLEDVWMQHEGIRGAIERGELGVAEEMREAPDAR